MREKSEAYYKAMFFNHPDLVFTLNETGLIDASNDSVSRISGYLPEEAIGRHFTHFIDPAYLQEAMSNKKRHSLAPDATEADIGFRVKY